MTKTKQYERGSVLEENTRIYFIQFWANLLIGLYTASKRCLWNEWANVQVGLNTLALWCEESAEKNCF